MKNFKKCIPVVLVGIFVLFLSFQSQLVSGLEGHRTFESSRAKLISSLIRNNLSSYHYSNKKIDDTLSKTAFDLYLKQLDYQKRFLLQEDVDGLNKYATKIDDEINTGIIQLPVAAAEIMNTRVNQVRKFIDEIFTAGFDFNKDEKFETDPEKREYCKTLPELKERWRKIVKYQVVLRFISMQEIEKADKNGEDSTSEPLKSDKELKHEAREKIKKNIDLLLDRVLESQEQENYDRYLDAFTRAFDPHTTYLPPTQKEDFDIHMRGSLEGIGARLQEKDGYIKVVAIMPGGAAAREGELEADDVILKVAEGSSGEPVDITDMKIRDAVSLIRGPKGSTVKLTVKKGDGRIKVIAIVRDVVQIEETFVKDTVIKDDSKKFGYIKIPTFYRDFSAAYHSSAGRNSTDDVRKALEELNDDKISGLILDLRNNGGGALVDAVSIAGLFIDEGPVVQVKDSTGEIKIHSDKDKDIQYNGPVIVLVNKLSASASEILAGALQDYKRAIIMGGEHTHGKGTVQTIIDLDRSKLTYLPNMSKYKPLGALKITIQKFYRISGGSTQYKGVVPDIILPDRYEHLEYGEQYVENSLPWDTIAPTDYHTRNTIGPKIQAIIAKSSKRVAGDEDFKEIEEEAEKAAERKDKTLISLKIDDIMKDLAVQKEDADSQSPSYHGYGLGDEEEEAMKNGKLSEEERLQLWIDEVKKDPYVKEAVNVLEDLNS